MISGKVATFIAFRDIVTRSLLTSTTPVARSSLSTPARCISSQTPSRFRTLSTTTQCRTLSRHDNDEAFRENISTPRKNTTNHQRSKRKPSNKRALESGALLRKVAVEAQLSRHALIRGSGKLQYIDPEVPTKDVTAYCAAETYNLSVARAELQREGYRIDPVGTGLGEEVLHIQTPNYLARDEETGAERPQGAGDVFVFPSGCVVTWNVPEPLGRTIVTRFLPAAAGVSGHLDRMEAEDMEYIEDHETETSKIVGETIVLGTKPTTSFIEDGPKERATASDLVAVSTDAGRETGGEIDTVLTKIAFSSALARSTKLAVLEESLSAYFASTRSIPSTLSTGRTIRITRRHILRKTGELLSIRAQLNLYSELTDSLPDLFWDSRHELGLEGYYDMLGRTLDVGVRIKVLNEKMDYAGEIAAVLRERLSEKHSTMLEWMIIGLICIEVGFGVVHLIREKTEMDEMRRIRELAQTWLETQLVVKPSAETE